MSHPRRVVVTGIGLASPLGNDPHTFFERLINGQSGIRHLQAAFADQLSNKIAAQVDFDEKQHLSRQEINLMDRASHLGVYAAQQAIADAQLETVPTALKHAAVYMGIGMAGSNTLDNGYVRLYREQASTLKPFTVLMVMTNAAASQIALKYGIVGPCLTYSVACSSSSVAIGEAFRQIRHGYADVIIAGGTEAPLSYGQIRAWESLRALGQEDSNDPSASCKPFSANRNGLVLGEGSAVMILEDYAHAHARGATIYAEISGYGITNDSAHITQPSVEGQASAMIAGLNSAGLQAGDIHYINAHGTGTALNDVTETNAVKQVFGARAYQIPMSSTKSMHGHLLGASGALEAIATVLALKHGTLPPTINLHQPDPECDLDYIPHVARREISAQHAMSNSFAFGGTDVSLVISKFHAA